MGVSYVARSDGPTRRRRADAEKQPATADIPEEDI